MSRIVSKELPQPAIEKWLTWEKDAIAGLTKNNIHNSPWSKYTYKPLVSFYIGNNADTIFLKFIVDEEERRVVTTEINGPVWEDSCVEFFVSFDKQGYYNLEFNAAGVSLVGFGKNRKERVLLKKEVIKKIKTVSSFSINGDGVHWELSIVIPVDLFVHHKITSLHNLTCRANFYKCGDKLKQPHFLSWAPIEHPEPNFHLPDFFGELFFE